MESREHKGNNGYIDSLKIDNFFSIVELGLSGLKDRKEVYFLGENGAGKTLILMSIVITFKSEFIYKFSNLEETGKIIDLIGFYQNGPYSQRFNFSYSGKDSSFKNYILNDQNNNLNIGEGFLSNLIAYGVHRSKNDSDKASPFGFMTLFDDDQYLINPNNWLMKLYTAELEKEVHKSKRSPILSLRTAKKILSDLVDNNIEIEVTSKGVTFTEKGTPLRFFQLAEGYKSVIVWVSDMVSRLTESQPHIEKIQDLEGIVLVDEINLHLHPNWERKIVKKLRSWFPKVQFFFTTHSPITVLGASDDAVFYKVYKENGITQISEPYFKADLNNQMVNTIVTSPLFGLEDARMSSDAPALQDLDTSDDYLYSRIHNKIAERLEQRKKSGKLYFSPEEIDQMIDNALNEEAPNYDKP